jgi:hypothetical protein
LALFTLFIPKTCDEQGYIQLASYMLLSTLSGAIGCAVLLRSHADLGGIDVLHATRAALGGAIIVGSIFIIAPLVFPAVILFIISPLWQTISIGAQWVVDKRSF